MVTFGMLSLEIYLLINTFNKKWLFSWDDSMEHFPIPSHTLHKLQISNLKYFKLSKTVFGPFAHPTLHFMLANTNTSVEKKTFLDSNNEKKGEILLWFNFKYYTKCDPKINHLQQISRMKLSYSRLSFIAILFYYIIVIYICMSDIVIVILDLIIIILSLYSL